MRTCKKKTGRRPRLSEGEKGIIRRAMSRHYNALVAASNKCVGSLYPGIYYGEAERTRELAKRLVAGGIEYNCREGGK